MIEMPIVAGIDIGSATSKVVILRDDEILSFVILPTGAEWKAITKLALERTLGNANLHRSDLSYIVSTGYGRRTVDFANETISEISAHCRGVKKLHQNVRTIIDIGGQDSKTISLDENGVVIDFVMNDRCAAGTGRFLEHMATVLGVKIEELGKLALSSEKPAKVSSMCTVFAESEVISLLAQAWKKEDIIAGLHEAIAKRVVAMARQTRVTEDIVFSGGVAKNSGMRKALEMELGTQIHVPQEPQITAALGAALIGQKAARKT